MMRLRYSPTSPFVRKVSVCALELELDTLIERIPTNPWDPASDIAVDNPLGRVPALTLDDGTLLYDSPVICEYLDSLAGSGRLFPVASVARWTALRRQALADGLLDTAITVFIEQVRRPQDLRWADWVEFQQTAVTRTLDALEGEAELLEIGAPTIGEIAIACALDWLVFRGVRPDWREQRPRLAAWHGEICQRPAFVATVPREPS